MPYKLLNRINSPADLKKLDTKACEHLAGEIRHFLINSVSKTGGHLASNLGTVELTIALHRVFDSPNDRMIFDVGHQSYTHKILTGRRSRFDTLRKKDGISGFPKPHESLHDAFISGHSSTSISAALGIAQAFRIQGRDNSAIAIIGDGAFTGGQIYEALNNAGRSKSRIVIVLNHNDMSISKNVGGFARYLTNMRSEPGYLKLKQTVESALNKTPFAGKPVKEWLQSSKSLVKTLIYRSTFFEEMGFSYLGPVDGHNLDELHRVLSRAKELGEPVVVQVETIKGKGYTFAEENPGAFHATAAFDPDLGNVGGIVSDCYSDNLGQYIDHLADSDKRICAITAAMKYGTGLNHFYQHHKDRFFDVGIAEPHATTFAGGLATEGLVPIFAVYSSFLQRAFDQVLHDLAIENLHCVLAIDRAGIVGEDGETHQGVFDAAFLSQIPNVTLYSPEGYEETRLCMKEAIDGTGIVGIRYPRGNDKRVHKLTPTTKHTLVDNGGVLVISYGRVFSNCFTAAKLLNTPVSLLKLTQICPIEDEVILTAMRFGSILFVEEGMKHGGIAEQFACRLIENGYVGQYKIVAIEQFVPQASVEQALESLGMDADGIAKTLCTMVPTERNNV